MEKHSEKGLTTLALLGTKPEDWGLVPIKWEKQNIEVPTKVKCPTCYGIGQAHFELDGSLAINNIDSKKDYYRWNTRQLEIHRLRRDRCPTCPPKRNHWGHSYGTGEVTKMVKREVMVGIILWEKDSIFDSRFNSGLHCHLCNKLIQKSGRVPVHGKDQNGIVHNMWIGEDCARKFLGIIKAFKKDEFLSENLEGPLI
jgi:hypothetical protein